MGQKMLEFYDEVKKIGGLNAQVRFAILTLTPSTKANTLPDSPELIDKFEKALSKIKSEFKKK